MLRTHLTTTVTFTLFLPGGLIVYHFKQQVSVQKDSLRRRMGCSHAFCLVCWAFTVGGPLLLLTSIVMRAGFIIHSWPGPLHTSVNTAAPRWAWMGFSGRPSLQDTHTHTHTHTNNTGDPTHLLPKPNNSPVSPSCALLSCLFVLQVSAPPSQKVSKQRSEVVASHYSQRWCQQHSDLRGHRCKNVDFMTIRGKINVL